VKLAEDNNEIARLRFELENMNKLTREAETKQIDLLGYIGNMQDETV